jgi:nicotinamide-nucleotide adenylyltransferase
MDQRDLIDARRISVSGEVGSGYIVGSGYTFPNYPHIKPFKFGFMLGRFQHIHIGHEMVISKALQVVDKLLILVGSAQEFQTARNPFNATTRIDLIQEVYKHNPNVIVWHLDDLTHEDDHSTDWGRYVLSNVARVSDMHNIRTNPDVMIYGNDEERRSWFDPKDIEKVSQLIINRGEINISATELRKMMAQNNFYKWREYVNPALHPKFTTIRNKLLETPFYKEMAPK